MVTIIETAITVLCIAFLDFKASSKDNRNGAWFTAVYGIMIIVGVIMRNWR